jgi:hypothetical protein
MKSIFSVTLLSSFSIFSFSQSISNVTASQQGNNALITYDLNGPAGASYYVKLSYSTDGGQTFGNELTQVTGDVKAGVKTGIGKKITWAADKEVNYLNSSVVFKVEAESRKASAKPITIENVTVEIIQAKRNGEQLTIEFLVTQNREKEIQEISLKRECLVVMQDGTQYSVTNGKFGINSLGYSSSDYVKCLRGIGTKGILTFTIANVDQILPAFNMNLYIASVGNASFVFRNIPVQ